VEYKEKLESEKKKKKGSSFLNLFTSVTKGTNKTIEEVDNWYNEYKAYIQELEPNLNNLQSRESSIIKQKKNIANNLDEISTTTEILSKVESSDSQMRDPDLGRCFNELHMVLQECSIETNNLSKEENEQFNHTLKDYIRYMDSIKQIISNRDNALLTYQNDMKDLQAKKDKLKSNEENQKLVQFVQTAEATLDVSRKEYERLNETVKQELTTFQKLKRFEITQAIKNLVQLNMEYHMKVGNLWKGLFIGLDSNEVST